MLSVQESNSTIVHSQPGLVALDHSEKKMQTVVVVLPSDEQHDLNFKKKVHTNKQRKLDIEFFSKKKTSSLYITITTLVLNFCESIFLCDECKYVTNRIFEKQTSSLI